MSNLSINTENNIKITDKKCNFFLLKRKIKTKKKRFMYVGNCISLFNCSSC